MINTIWSIKYNNFMRVKNFLLGTNVKCICRSAEIYNVIRVDDPPYKTTTFQILA